MTVSNPAPDPERVKEQEEQQRKESGQPRRKSGDADTPEPTQPPAPPLNTVPGHEQA
jgi:hypothetical protein